MLCIWGRLYYTNFISICYKSRWCFKWKQKRRGKYTAVSSNWSVKWNILFFSHFQLQTNAETNWLLRLHCRGRILWREKTKFMLVVEQALAGIDHWQLSNCFRQSKNLIILCLNVWQRGHLLNAINIWWLGEKVMTLEVWRYQHIRIFRQFILEFVKSFRDVIWYKHLFMPKHG